MAEIECVCVCVCVLYLCSLTGWDNRGQGLIERIGQLPLR